jgi:galactokinase
MAAILPRPAILTAVSGRRAAALRETLQEAFQERYGRPATGVWAAPGRVNLIGEHTDYNRGFVLPFGLPHRTYLAAAPADGWRVWSDQTGEEVRFGPADLVPGAVTGWAGYVAGVVWALREAGYDMPGAHLAVTSDVPLGAGLSSSASLECAVLTALVDLAGLPVPPADRTRLAWRAEHDFVGVPCGIMDQSAVLLCRRGHALFLDCGTGQHRHVPLDLAAAELAMLVIDTRAPHRLVSGEYADRRTACERAAAALDVAALRDVPIVHLEQTLAHLDDPLTQRRVRHVVTENQRVQEAVTLLEAGAARQIGPLLSASHASLRDDFDVTVPELDVAAEAAEAAGALGARMTGGGFGGCVIALVDAGDAARVGEAVTAAFADRNFAAPSWCTVSPGDGASRIG